MPKFCGFKLIKCCREDNQKMAIAFKRQTNGKLLSAFFVLAAFSTISLQTTFAQNARKSDDKDLRELLRLHEQQKTAHLTNNAELFVEMFSDPFTQIQNGNILTFSKEKSLARFKNYFATMKFQEWSDIATPVVKISKDGTLATMTVNKRVRAAYKNEKGEEEKDYSIFAWLTVWEKIGGKWKVTTIASTAKYGKDEK